MAKVSEKKTRKEAYERLQNEAFYILVEEATGFLLRQNMQGTLIRNRSQFY